MVKHLLVPVDFSDYAYNAALNAVILAQNLNAQVTIFHAYHIPIVDPLMPSEYLGDLAESAEREITNSMNLLVQKLKKESNDKAAIASHITMGFAVDEIVAACDKLKPDMIVMGRRYTEGMTKILLGSITSTIVEKASAPVLVIPENVSPSTAITSVLYASEFDEADERVLRRLLNFTKPLKAKIHFVHVLSDSVPDSRKKLLEFEKKYADEVAKGSMDFQNVLAESVTDGLLEFSETHNINLMAMLTHKRSFFTKLFDRSLTKKVAFKSNIPLLVFHASHQ